MALTAHALSCYCRVTTDWNGTTALHFFTFPLRKGFRAPGAQDARQRFGIGNLFFPQAPVNNIFDGQFIPDQVLHAHAHAAGQTHCHRRCFFSLFCTYIAVQWLLLLSCNVLSRYNHRAHRDTIIFHEINRVSVASLLSLPMLKNNSRFKLRNSRQEA